MIIYKNQSPWGSPLPGGNGNGGYRRGPTPPDIEEIIGNIQKINKFMPGKVGGKSIVLGLVILANLGCQWSLQSFT